MPFKEADFQFEGLTITFAKEATVYDIPGFDEEIIFEIITDEPQKALRILHKYLEEYPKHPIISHWLGVAHSVIDENEEKINEVITASFKAYPDYLHNRISYALICLNAGDFDCVSALFNDFWDLKALFPDKKNFHFLEVALFHQLAVQYFIEIAEYERAEEHLDRLKKLYDDEHDESLLALKEMINESKKLDTLIASGIFGIEDDEE